jgi:hypoxanthine phosphoribosyltransferase
LTQRDQNVNSFGVWHLKFDIFKAAIWLYNLSSADEPSSLVVTAHPRKGGEQLPRVSVECVRCPMSQRQEVLTWNDVVCLVEHLMPQMEGVFDALLLITRGGIIPGGMMAERMDINYVLTAAVRFPADLTDRRLAWPTFLQFPEDALLRGRRVLVVDDIWSGGETIMTVVGRVEMAGARAETAVLHYRPGSNFFKEAGPTYYAAITDALIVYPWEVGHGPEGMPLPGLSCI